MLWSSKILGRFDFSNCGLERKQKERRLTIFNISFCKINKKIVLRNYLFLSIEQLSCVLLSNSQSAAVIDHLILPFLPAFYEKKNLLFQRSYYQMSMCLFLKRSILCGRIRKRLNQLGLVW